MRTPIYYQCPVCQQDDLICPEHCVNCGYVKKMGWFCSYAGYWGCSCCGVCVESFYAGTLPVQNQDIQYATEVDSGAGICWLLVGMLGCLLAGSVLAVLL